MLTLVVSYTLAPFLSFLIPLIRSISTGGHQYAAYGEKARPRIASIFFFMFADPGRGTGGSADREWGFEILVKGCDEGSRAC